MGTDTQPSITAAEYPLCLRGEDSPRLCLHTTLSPVFPCLHKTTHCALPSSPGESSQENHSCPPVSLQQSLLANV